MLNAPSTAFWALGLVSLIIVAWFGRQRHDY
jgi:hypothetical protein